MTCWASWSTPTPPAPALARSSPGAGGVPRLQGVAWFIGPRPSELDGGSAAIAAAYALPRICMVCTVEPGQDANALRVVLIDTRPERRLLVRHLIESTGLVATDIGEAASTAEAVELLDREDRDVVVIEIQMPVSQGLETIAALRGRAPGLRIVVCSFHRDPATKEQALARGADVYLDKPVSSVYLKALLRRFFPELPSEEAPPEAHAEPAPARRVRTPASGRRGGPSAEPTVPSE